MQRAAFPRDTTPTEPNGNDPADVPPATVGEDTYRPGDPNGLVLEGGPGGTWPRSRIKPSPWSGWPAEWATPNWGRVEQLTDTAWAALDLNSSILASMPPYLVGASESLPADWMNNPDPGLYTSWEEFAKQLFWEFQTGEAFLVATSYYSNTYPARFHVLDPWMVNVEMDEQGRRRYYVGGLEVTADLLHIRYKSRTGDAHGHGPLEAGAGRLVAANTLARYATNRAAAGGLPNAVLKHPARLNDTQASDLQWKWVEARMSSMGLPAVLSGGIEFETLAFSPKDLALVELAQFNESRIAVLLGVPPFLLGLPSGGDSMTYSNVVSLFDYHWRAGLRPKASTVVGALSGWLLPRGTTVELNRDEYVKPGPLERAQTWQILNGIVDLASGEPVLSVAEIRQLERYSNAAPSETLSSGVLQ